MLTRIFIFSKNKTIGCNTFRRRKKRINKKGEKRIPAWTDFSHCLSPSFSTNWRSRAVKVRQHAFAPGSSIKALLFTYLQLYTWHREKITSFTSQPATFLRDTLVCILRCANKQCEWSNNDGNDVRHDNHFLCHVIRRYMHGDITISDQKTCIEI